MAKTIHDDVFDGALNILRDNCTRVVVCSAQPTTYTEANATYMLANVTVDSTDFTIANGSVSGRKITLAQQTGITITNSGTATYVAWLDVANSKLSLVTTCTSQALTASNTLTINAHKFEIADPT